VSKFHRIGAVGALVIGLLVTSASAQGAQAGGVRLEPAANPPISIRKELEARTAFEMIAEAAGVRVFFDADFGGAPASLELDSVGLYEALDAAARATRAFWKPVAKDAILVAPDDETKRRSYLSHDPTVIRLAHRVSRTEIAEVVAALRGLLNLGAIAVHEPASTLLVVAAPEVISAAQRILQDVDAPKSVVTIEAIVLEVNSAVLSKAGVLPPLEVNSASPSNFLVNVSEKTARSLISSPGATILQRPQARAADGETAQIRIGSRAPVNAGDSEPSPGSEYIDVGVTVELTPRVSKSREVFLTARTQVQIVAGDRNVAGRELPIFSNRTVQHQIRLVEGETSILGGIINDAEAASLAKTPALKNVPILRYLFSGDPKRRRQSELVVMLTPRIVTFGAPTQVTEAQPPGDSITSITLEASNGRPPASQPVIAAAPRSAQTAGYTVQLAAFGNRESAEALLRRLARDYADAFIETSSKDRRTLHHVRVGRFPNRAAAEQVARKLRREGFDAFVTAIE